MAGGRNAVAPLSRPLLWWNTSRRMLGARPMNRAANIHDARCAGAAARKSGRAGAGTDTRGRSDARAPGARVTVSRERKAVAVPRAMTTARLANTMRLAWWV